MLIRSEQMRAMEQHSALAFENRMVERIRTYFPKPGELLGDSQLRVIVRLANVKSQNHLLTHERSVALYLDLMLVLGSGFDTDPQIPWAAEILADPRVPSQAERIDLLHHRGWEYGQTISSDFESQRVNRSRSCLIEGMVEIRHKALDELTPPAAQSTAADILARLQDLAIPLRPREFDERSHRHDRGIRWHAHEDASVPPPRQSLGLSRLHFRESPPVPGAPGAFFPPAYSVPIGIPRALPSTSCSTAETTTRRPSLMESSIS